MTDMAAVILVGGQSSRMGRDKALLTLHGQRLLDVVADVVRDAGIEAVYLSGKEATDGIYGAYPYIPDAFLQCGPVGGVCSSLMQLAGQYDRVLFVPVDLPLLSVALLHELMRSLPDRACYFAEHPLPCILPLNAATLRHVEIITHALAQGQKISVREFLAGLYAVSRAVPASLTQALTNTNTAAQWLLATNNQS